MTSQAARVVLKPGREKSLRHRHPWIFSGAIENIEGDPAKGDTVAVVGKDGSFLAWAAYSPDSQIVARAWSFEAKDTIDAAFLRAKLEASIARRNALVRDDDAMRLVHGESDGLPGLVADRYGDTIVLQILSAGAEKWRDHWAPLLVELTGANAVYERSDVEVRALEGLGSRTGTMLGHVTGPVRIHEEGIVYDVDVVHGQKTGFYLDQRDNRVLAGALAGGARGTQRVLLHRRFHARGAEGRRHASDVPRHLRRGARRGGAPMSRSMDSTNRAPNGSRLMCFRS